MITEVRQAIAYLRERQLPLSLNEAIGVLREAAQEDRFLALYYHFFPKDFARSKASQVRPAGQAYSEREIEFFELVNRQCFPIPALTDHMLVDWEGEERSPYLPIEPWGRDWWNEYDLEPGWQILLLLAEEFTLDTQTHYALTLHRRPDWPEIERLLQRALPLRVSRERLENVAAQHGEPLCALPLALRVVRHDTDNIWLDTTPEMPIENVFWCVENIELLTKEWEQAAEIMQRVTGLVSWLEVDFVAQLRKVVELWQSAYV